LVVHVPIADADSSTPRPILDLIAAHQSFVLSGHENPDGDCLGAQVALYHLLHGLGKRVAIVNPDPLTRTYDFLARHTPFSSLRPGAPLPAAEVLVLLDCAWLSRLGKLGERFAAARNKIAVIDHHVGSERGDGSVAYVDHEAPATGSLVHDLWQALGRALTPPAAEGVMLSLVADTGWFRYSNTDARALKLAGQLVEAGVDACALYDRLHRRNQPDSVEILGTALIGARLRLDGRFGYACLDRALVERAARADFDTDVVMEPLRSLDRIEVVALFKERQDGAIKLSLRAKGGIDVHAIAAQLGGGGHKKAAGATLRLPIAQAITAVEQKVREALQAAGMSVGP
jgi:phosphoesterase RecJ-like protein